MKDKGSKFQVDKVTLSKPRLDNVNLDHTTSGQLTAYLILILCQVNY